MLLGCGTCNAGSVAFVTVWWAGKICHTESFYRKKGFVLEALHLCVGDRVCMGMCKCIHSDACAPWCMYEGNSKPRGPFSTTLYLLLLEVGLSLILELTLWLDSGSKTFSAWWSCYKKIMVTRKQGLIFYKVFIFDLGLTMKTKLALNS
jgi:hypothetical protein